MSRLPIAVACLYLLAPGHPALPLGGLPLGLTGAAALAALIGAAWWVGDVRPPPPWRRAALVVLAICVAVKVAIGLGAPHEGWRARYYTNDRFMGAPERSTDFPGLDATRVDRVLNFEGSGIPAYFLNHLRLEMPAGRSQLVVEQPLSVAWTGYVAAEGQTAVPIALTARGTAWVVVDSVERARVESAIQPGAATATIDLSPGVHRVDVSYIKPANTAGRLSLDGLAPVAPDEASAVALQRSGVARTLAWIAHLAASVTLVIYLAALVRLRLRREEPRERRLARGLAVAVLLLFGIQGLMQGLPHLGRVWDLTTGDDWFGFEARARDVLLNGPLMTLGAPPGSGQPYFYYPLYSYFAAAVHRLVGEDGSGIVFAQFLVLAATTLAVYQLARELFGDRVALGSALLLVAIEQLAFVRYYTVTMLADNLYVLPVALSVLFLTRFSTAGRLGSLLSAGAWIGIAALTKPGALAFFALSVPFVLFLEWTRARGRLTAVVRTGAYVAVTLAVVGVATVRNIVVSGRPVLITEGQGPTFIHYSLPPDLVEREGYTLTPAIGLTDNIARLARIAADHPVEYARWNSRKVMFSLGFVHLQNGYRPHPELLLTAAGWLLAIALVPAARARAAWPAHLFVISHLATMVLTLPWVYGYRLILPTFVIIPVFAAAAGDAVWTRLVVRAPNAPAGSS